MRPDLPPLHEQELTTKSGYKRLNASDRTDRLIEATAHLAASKGHAVLVGLLLEQGAPPLSLFPLG